MKKGEARAVVHTALAPLDNSDVALPLERRVGAPRRGDQVWALVLVSGKGEAGERCEGDGDEGGLHLAVCSAVGVGTVLD